MANELSTKMDLSTLTGPYMPLKCSTPLHTVRTALTHDNIKIIPSFHDNWPNLALNVKFIYINITPVLHLSRVLVKTLMQVFPSQHC